ncbi:MAG: hypothetical protein KA788_07510 [Lacunisphaera sp.]|nr:hypothetical protein [Lacunisphaera sp.]
MLAAWAVTVRLCRPWVVWDLGPLNKKRSGAGILDHAQVRAGEQAVESFVHGHLTLNGVGPDIVHAPRREQDFAFCLRCELFKCLACLACGQVEAEFGVLWRDLGSGPAG